MFSSKNSSWAPNYVTLRAEFGPRAASLTRLPQHDPHTTTHSTPKSDCYVWFSGEPRKLPTKDQDRRRHRHFVTSYRAHAVRCFASSPSDAIDSQQNLLQPPPPPAPQQSGRAGRGSQNTTPTTSTGFTAPSNAARKTAHTSRSQTKTYSEEKRRLNNLRLWRFSRLENNEGLKSSAQVLFL